MERYQTRPISHVAAEMGIARACVSNWVHRHRQFGALGLLDRPSVLHHQPTATAAGVVGGYPTAAAGALTAGGASTPRRSNVSRPPGPAPATYTCTRQSTGSPASPLPLALRAGRYPHRSVVRREDCDRNRVAPLVRVFFAAHGIGHIHRIVTDNGSYYRAKDFDKVLRGAWHQRTSPYTPRHNGKVERFGPHLGRGVALRPDLNQRT